jgi:hypothetical protein
MMSPEFGPKLRFNEKYWPDQMGPQLAETLLHELGHLAGIDKNMQVTKEDDPLFGWHPSTGAFHFDDLLNPLDEIPEFKLYKQKHPECFGGCCCTPGETSNVCPIHGKKK